MKKMLIAALAVVASMSVASANGLYKNMGLLEQGLNNVQQGYLYNAPELLEAGVKTLIDANDALSKEDMRSTLPQGASTAAIDNLTEAMQKNIVALQNATQLNDTPKAVEAYGAVVKNCIACHIAIRD
ncbi:MAG: hypothetical protein ACQESH_04045 [Campylobacterota bacterium]